MASTSCVLVFLPWNLKKKFHSSFYFSCVLYRPPRRTYQHAGVVCLSVAGLRGCTRDTHLDIGARKWDCFRKCRKRTRRHKRSIEQCSPPSAVCARQHLCMYVWMQRHIVGKIPPYGIPCSYSLRPTKHSEQPEMIRPCCCYTLSVSSGESRTLVFVDSLALLPFPFNRNTRSHSLAR